jgi:IS30 family transposase
MTIVSLVQQRYTIMQIALRLKRSAGTILRELKRSAQDGCFASQVATTCARQRRRSGRPRGCPSGRLLRTHGWQQ